MSQINLTLDQYLEFEKIGLGTFHPLTGFMNEQEFRSVVSNMRLPTGELFPLPVLLDLKKTSAQSLRPGISVACIFRNKEVGRIAIEDVFNADKADSVPKLFGTGDRAHPGVNKFLNGGEVFVGGKVTFTERITLDHSYAELTPEETKAYFKKMGWATVAGFQTRNVPHRAHEYLLRMALESTDGLFIQPLVGFKKTGDMTPAAILKSYRVLIDQFLPKERVVLGVLSTAMRYAGPREALFHAIIRRNYGCTHFIVGRDHAGVGNYYGKYEAQLLARKYEPELGIRILPFAGPFYCRICDGIATDRTCSHWKSAPEKVLQISGKDIRRYISSRKECPPELMRPEILDSLDSTDIFIQESQ